MLVLSWYHHIISLLLTLGLFLPTASISAHLIGGTHEVLQDGYFIDIGYVPEFPVTDRVTRLDFTVRDQSNSNQNIFKSVWVRITHVESDTVIFSGSLHHPRFGPAAMGLVFTKAGKYKIYSRFEYDFDIITETEFFLQVDQVEIERDCTSLHCFTPLSWVVMATSLTALVIFMFQCCFIFKIKRKRRVEETSVQES